MTYIDGTVLTGLQLNTSFSQKQDNLNNLNAVLDMGNVASPNYPIIKFHTGGNPVDFDSQISASGGTGTNGQGTLTLIAGNISLKGAVTINNSPVATTAYVQSALSTGTTSSNTALSFEIGSKTASSSPFINFHSSGGSIEYDSRITGTAGNPAVAGQGTLNVVAQSFQFNGSGVLTSTTGLLKNNNLSDLPSISSARSNLGLGGAATLNIGTSNGTVAAGDDSRITGALTLSSASSLFAPINSPMFTGTPFVPGYLTTATAALTYAPINSTSNPGAGYLTTAAAALTYAPLAGPNFTGVPTAPTAASNTNSTQIATTAFVKLALTASTAGVSTFNGRTGAINLTTADVTTVGGALSLSPAFTGTPTAPTASNGTNNTQIATTAFVNAAVNSATAGVSSFNGRNGTVSLTLADITSVGGISGFSPNFTGTPTAPTPSTGNSSTQLATTAFVINAISSSNTGTGTAGVTTFNGRNGTVFLTLADVTGTGGAPVSNPNFTGIPMAPTATSGTNTTQIATTAFVARAVSALSATTSGVSSLNGRVGDVALVLSDITAVGGAPINGPNFTGAPTAPTASVGTNSAQLATTAFVVAAVNGVSVTSANINQALATGSLIASKIDNNATGGQIRIVAGSAPSVMLRNDSVNFYLLDSASATGGFSSHRPFFWNLSTGDVTLAGNGEGTSLGGRLYVAGTSALAGLIQASDSISLGYTSNHSCAPTANPALDTRYGLNVQGTTGINTSREWIGCFGLTSNKGDKVAYPPSTPGKNDKVALYAGIDIYQGSADSWAINSVVTLNSNCTNVTAQGYELDFNNLSNDKSQDFANAAFGLSITGASSYQNTAAMLVSENLTPRWTRGILFTNKSIRDATIVDSTTSTIILQSTTNHAVGIDFTNANFTSYALGLKAGVVGEIAWTNGIQAVTDNVDSNLLRTVGIGSNGVYTGGATLAPVTNNSASCGSAQNRWSSIYAVNGAIQTSDVSLKTNIEKVPNTLALLNDINPIKFNWLEGGKEITKVKKMKMVQATETKQNEVKVNKEINGKITLVTEIQEEKIPLYDELPVHDETGNPIVDHIPADHQKGERWEPRMHIQPRMIEQEVEEDEYISKPGKRTHWGFVAQEVKAAMEKHGMGDFGGHVVTEDGTEALRPDQLIPILWRALQQVSAKVDELEAKLV